MIFSDSDEEYQRELRSAFEQYKSNQKPETKDDTKRNELARARKSRKMTLMENYTLNGMTRRIFEKYENQGAIPKGIYNVAKSDGKEKRGRDHSRSQSRAGGSRSRGRKQLDLKSDTREKNSGLDKTVPNGDDSDANPQSFYYIVPEEPSPDFCLSPGTYHVVSEPLDLSIETVLVYHPSRSGKDSSKNDSKTGKHRRKSMEHFVVRPESLNDLNKSERNCSNVNLARDLISEYNAGHSKIDILTKIMKLKSDLEAEIEGFKLALTESTMALDQLETLAFSLKSIASLDEKEFRSKEVTVEDDEDDFKGTESVEGTSAEVKSPAENSLVNKEDGEGGSDVTPVENSPDDSELTTAQEEGTIEDPLVSAIVTEEQLYQDWINNKILYITSVLPDICEDYLRSELEKMEDDANLINIFVNTLIEGKNYPKSEVGPEENERKRLWEEYVTDFNPKKFLFQLSTVSPEGPAASNSNDNDDTDLVLSFLRRRYPTLPLTDLRDNYEKSKNIAKVCVDCDVIERPVRLAESGFWEEKFNKEFLLKVTYLDHQQEIDNYLSEALKRRELEREEAKLCNAFLQCLTCYGQIVPSETTTCSEGHVFCSDCVEEYIRVEIGNGNYEFKCFSGDCDAFFSQKTLEELLPASVLMKISMKQQAKEVMEAKVDGLESCSFCDFAYVPDSDDKIFKCRNPACMAEICRKCRERSHIPLRCNEIERPKDLEARKKIEEAMTNTLLRTCPSCKRKIVRMDGCNKMTCVCGTMFCYLCRQQITGYSHFGLKCPTYTNDRELHYQRVAEAGIQTRDELLRADIGIEIVHDPTKGF